MSDFTDACADCGAGIADDDPFFLRHDSKPLCLRCGVARSAMPRPALAFPRWRSLGVLALVAWSLLIIGFILGHWAQR